MEQKSILTQFQALGYNENSLFTKDAIQTQINRIIKKQNHPQYKSLDPHVASEVWQQCSKSGDQVSLTEYIKVIVLAKRHLEDRLTELQIKINQKTADKKNIEKYLSTSQLNDPKKRAQLSAQLQNIDNELYQYTNDHQDFTGDFNNILVLIGKRDSLKQSNMRVSVPNRGSIDPTNLNQSKQNAYQPLNNSGRQSQIFFKRSDKTLMALLVLTLIVCILELLVMNHKYHFLNILFAIGLLSIFALNYFDRYHIKFLLILDGISFILDLVWLIVKADAFWNTSANTPESNLNRGYLRFIVFFVAIIMVIKIIIFGLLYSYQNVQQRTSITVCGYDVNLTGEPGQSPISKMFMPARISQQSLE